MGRAERAKRAEPHHSTPTNSRANQQKKWGESERKKEKKKRSLTRKSCVFNRDSETRDGV